jgi:hypothetical protein
VCWLDLLNEEKQSVSNSCIAQWSVYQRNTLANKTKNLAKPVTNKK